MLYNTNKEVRAKVDKYLHKMAMLFQNIGKDSTKEEVQQAYAMENIYIDMIADIDPEKAKSIRPYGS